MKIEDYRKGEPTKSKRLIIKKQKRSSLWRKKKKKKNPLRTMDDFRGEGMLRCYLKSIYMLDCIRIAMLGINI
jgi:hypothetical protein